MADSLPVATGQEEQATAQTTPEAQATAQAAPENPEGLKTPEEPEAPEIQSAAASAQNEEDPMQNSIQNGDTMNYTPADDVAGGSLVVFANMVAVAITDIAAGETGSLGTVGVYELPKGSIAFAQGQAVYAAADGTLSATAGEGLIPAGKAWSEAAGGDAVVAVKINV